MEAENFAKVLRKTLRRRRVISAVFGGVTVTGKEDVLAAVDARYGDVKWGEFGELTSELSHVVCDGAVVFIYDYDGAPQVYVADIPSGPGG